MSANRLQAYYGYIETKFFHPPLRRTEGKMLWYKDCPRCEIGDMYLDEDDARHCMQCGYKQYTTAAAMEPETARLFNLEDVLNGSVGSETKRELVTA